MAGVLVFVEHHNGTFVPSSLGVLAKGKQIAAELGGELAAVVAGSGIEALAGSLGAFGAARVFTADDPRYADPVAGPLVDVLQAAVVAAQPSVVMASASVVSAEVAGALAARLGSGINTDGTDLRVDGGNLVFTRPALDDSVRVDCTWAGADASSPAIALFRANSFQPASANGGQAAIEPLSVTDTGRPAVTYEALPQTDTGGVDITQADVLVGAGRGLGGPDNFGIVESLAKSLGGEVATTRAVVDAGWYDYSTQVGQTGKTVAPKLYVAVGISGAIQHKIGMQSASTIVAINKDPNAPIFDFADFGVVGDLFTVVPKLEAAIKAKKGG